MAFENFPYADLHSLNLDWLLAKVKELEAKVNDLEDRVAALEGS